MRVSTSVANTKKKDTRKFTCTGILLFCIYSAPARHEQDAERLRMATLINFKIIIQNETPQNLMFRGVF